MTDRQEILNWQELRQCVGQYHDKALLQLINIYSSFGQNLSEFKFGDEIEYVFVHFDKETQKAQASLDCVDVYKRIHESSHKFGSYQLEAVKYLFESSPTSPFSLHDLVKVVKSMELRRTTIKRSLANPNKSVLTLAALPRTNCDDNLWRANDVKYSNRDSEMFSSGSFEEKYITKSRVIFENNIEYSETKPSVKGYQEKDLNRKDLNSPTPKLIILNHDTGFCALQVTIQARNLEEVKVLRDNLALIAPIMLALSAASPIMKGYLLETDTRYNILNDIKTSPRKDTSHEYDLHTQSTRSILSFISPGSERFNDVETYYNPKVFDILMKIGMDELLAKYYAMMFTKVPLHLLRKDLSASETDTNLFENVQGIFWQSVKLKAPLKQNDGWRCEFRVCDVQLTDFENAALETFVVLCTQALCHFNVDLRIPISQLNENIQTASIMDAITQERFWYAERKINQQYDNICNAQMYTVNDIVNGKSGVSRGLIGYIYGYLETEKFSKQDFNVITKYLDHIALLASGKRETTASWIRHYVRSHGSYKFDSVVNNKIVFDLLKDCEKLRKEYLDIVK